jgi:hypothetical protein
MNVNESIWRESAGLPPGTSFICFGILRRKVLFLSKKFTNCGARPGKGRVSRITPLWGDIPRLESGQADQKLWPFCCRGKDLLPIQDIKTQITKNELMTYEDVTPELFSTFGMANFFMDSAHRLYSTVFSLP